MNHLKKIAGIVLAVVMCVGLSVPALAAEGDDVAERAGITYDVFQIFTGQYADKGSNTQGAGALSGETLSNVKWGKNAKLPDGKAIGDLVDATVLAELDGLVHKDADGNATDQGEQNTGDVNRERLAVILKYVDLESTPLHSGVESIAAVKALTLDNGYYLVRVTPGSIADGEVYPTYTVQVLDNHIENFKPKGFEGGVPTIDKKTGDGTESKSDAAIGDVVRFVVKGNLPTNLHDFYEYYWVVTDTMSEGLTWNAAKGVDANSAGVVSATIGGKDVLSSMHVSQKAENGEILMGFNNILDVKAADDSAAAVDGAEVVITYQAVVNESAKIGTGDNGNKAVLTYSNDPNHSGDGTTKNNPETPPTPKDPTGKTVEGEHTKTQTWVTGLTVEHYGNRGTPMTGSEFELTGDNIKTTIKYTSIFRAPRDGETATYYRLKNGGYTNVAPILSGEDRNDNQYESTTAGYVREDVLVSTNETPTNVKATIDTNGCLTITGLKAGHYVLRNTSIPNGYNIAEDVTFDIAFDEENLFTSNNDKVQERTPDWFYVTILAENGSLLPETGGSGVYFLYGGGAVLLLAAGALAFMKLRKRGSDAE